MGTIHGSGPDMFRHADYSLHLGSWIQPNVVPWHASGYRLAYVRQLRRAVFQSPRLWSTPSRPRQPHETPAATGAHAVPSFPRNAPRWPLARRVPARIRWRERALRGGRGRDRLTARPLPGVPGLHFGGCGCVSAASARARVALLACSSHPLCCFTASCDQGNCACACTTLVALAPAGAESCPNAERQYVATGCMFNHLVNHGWQTDRWNEPWN